MATDQLDRNPIASCTVCKKTIRTRSTVQYHKNCANPEANRHQCKLCSRRFATKSHRKFHDETHDGKRYSCSACDKSYQHRRDLELHRRTHDATRKYGCTRCTKTFSSADQLKAHREEKHQPKVKFSCDLCAMKFTLQGNLKKHMIVHTKERSFACPECGKTFLRQNALTFHLLSHKSRAYQCQSCFKEFIDARNLERHLKTHTALKEFKCSVCGIASSRRDNILRHAKSFHPKHDLEEVIEKVADQEQVDAIKSEAQKSSRTVQQQRREQREPQVPQPETQKPEEQNHSAVPPAKRISVIQVIGTPKADKPRPANDSGSEGTKSIAPAKPSVRLNPVDIYRKILKPSCDDDSSPSVATDKATRASEARTGSSKPCSNNDSLSSINNFAEVHWRKRTSQYFNNSTR